MNQHPDDTRFSLDALAGCIQASDLIPSHLPLLEGLEGKIQCLQRHGLRTVADLREKWRTKSRLAALAKETGIAMEYLVLLRREVEGYFPKPVALTLFPGVAQSTVCKLAGMGIHDSAQLLAAVGSEALAAAFRADADALTTLIQLADLARIRWVSPGFARMLVAAGYNDSAQVAAADAQLLHSALHRANENGAFSRTQIGFRDVQRLIHWGRFLIS